MIFFKFYIIFIIYYSLNLIEFLWKRLGKKQKEGRTSKKTWGKVRKSVKKVIEIKEIKARTDLLHILISYHRRLWNRDECTNHVKVKSCMDTQWTWSAQYQYARFVTHPFIRDDNLIIRYEDRQQICRDLKKPIVYEK